MTGAALVIRGDAMHLPLPDESVDLIVTSPPYFALRSYRDGDEHYSGQLGSEPTPQAFLEALWAVMAECWRVLKPTGSCFVNLGDKRSGSGGHNNAGIVHAGASDKSTLNNGGGRKMKALAEAEVIAKATRRNAPDRYNQAAFGRAKSKMLLPHRFAIGCEDGLADPEGKGWIMRQDVVWQKLNGLPESVTDRTRDSHEWLFAMTKQDDAYGWPEDDEEDKEMLFHFTKEPRYFASVDEVREPHSPITLNVAKYVNKGVGDDSGSDKQHNFGGYSRGGQNPLGKTPGSVWALASEPLIISPEVKAHYGLPDHFAAFPTELVRRVILGWSPTGICVGCGEGRRPVVAKKALPGASWAQSQHFDRMSQPTPNRRTPSTLGHTADQHGATITGYSCPCDDPQPETRPSVVLDPFLGSGTTTMVARALGRIGVGTDLSADYCRLAQWRTFRSGGGAKAVNRTNREAQEAML